MKGKSPNILKRCAAAVAVIAAALLALPACFDKTTNVLGQTQTSGGLTGGSPVVAPTPNTCPVARLAGGIFGDRGEPACAARAGNQIPIGCTALGTITPKLADGSDAPPAVHGQNVTASITQGSASAAFSEDSNNPFNYELRRTGAGLIQMKATLWPLGCAPLERTYDFP